MTPESLLSLENPVAAVYFLCSAIILLKTLSMSVFTPYVRWMTWSFSWPEDYGGKEAVKPPNIAVERVRRCHQNDLENNILFVLIGFLYILTKPSLFAAKLLCYGFVVFRLAHTIAFLNGLQPARAIVFTLALTINFFMAISVALHALPVVFS